MPAIEKSVTVAAAAERVYELVDDPERLPEFWPAMMEVTSTRHLAVGGHRFHYLYKMAGRRFEGDVETVDHVPGRRIVDEVRGELEGVFRWTFTPRDGVTRVDLHVEYDTPKGLLGKLREPVIGKLNEHEAQLVLENLKAVVEG